MLSKTDVILGMLRETVRKVESEEIDPFDAIDLLGRFADKVKNFDGDIDSEVERVMKKIQEEKGAK